MASSLGALPSPSERFERPDIFFRGAVKPPNGVYNLRSLMELNVLQGVGAIANKPKWWLKWRVEEIRSKWLQEIEREFVTHTLQQTLLEWPNWEEFGRVFLENVDSISRAPDAAERARMLAEARRKVVLAAPTWDDDNEEEDDEEDEENDYDEFIADGCDDETKVLVAKNMKRQSYGQIALYFLQTILWETAISIPEELWACGFNGVDLSTTDLSSTEAKTQLASLVRDHDASAAVEHAIESALGSHETRHEAHHSMFAHCKRIQDELTRVRSYVTQMLDLYVDKFNLHNDESSLCPGPVQETWLCDDLVDLKLRDKFISEVKVLEEVPEDQKDWHPNTKQQVLVLVHPSLYCCVFGKTSGLTTRPSVDSMSCSKLFLSGAEAVVQNRHKSSSVRFQWIPAEFSVDDESGKTKIMSYINNLHPEDFSCLYDSISSIFDRFVPLFDRVLNDLAAACPVARFAIPSLKFRDNTVHLPERLIVPDRAQLPFDSAMAFTTKGKTVQVIVKISEIQLKPENPKYNGGSWHVEGTVAEQIVATGLYYFGCDNITESRLSFRVAVGEPYYNQHDIVGMAAMYGLRNDERLVQHLGSVTAHNGRGVVFPNTFEHKVETFELADLTKPGTRKLLVFFLVDPTKTIPSSAVINAQQQDWIERAQAPVLKKIKLPEVVKSQVGSFAGAAMTLDEALAYRLELMTERSPDVENDGNPDLFFSSCEH